MSAWRLISGSGKRAANTGILTTGYLPALVSTGHNLLARHRVAKDHPPSSHARWNPQKDRVAYFSPHLLNPADREWRERKGRPGTHAPCQQPVYPRGLYAGADRSEAAGTTAARADDSLRRARCIGARDPGP